MSARKFPIDPDYRNSKRTICEVLREIHRLAQAKGLTEITERTDEAHDMAKRMSWKLTQYHKEWQDGFWRDNAPAS